MKLAIVAAKMNSSFDRLHKVNYFLVCRQQVNDCAMAESLSVDKSKILCEMSRDLCKTERIRTFMSLSGGTPSQRAHSIYENCKGGSAASGDTARADRIVDVALFICTRPTRRSRPRHRRKACSIATASSYNYPQLHGHQAVGRSGSLARFRHVLSQLGTSRHKLIRYRRKIC